MSTIQALVASGSSIVSGSIWARSQRRRPRRTWPGETTTGRPYTSPLAHLGAPAAEDSGESWMVLYIYETLALVIKLEAQPALAVIQCAL
jgi:hypothetical protein